MPQAVRGSGDGRRSATGRQGFWGRAGEEVPGARGCTNNIYVFIKDDLKLSMHLKSKVTLLEVI